MKIVTLEEWGKNKKYHPEFLVFEDEERFMYYSDIEEELYTRICYLIGDELEDRRKTIEEKIIILREFCRESEIHPVHIEESNECDDEDYYEKGLKYHEIFNSKLENKITRKIFKEIKRKLKIGEEF